MGKKLTNIDFINLSISIHGDTYLYTKSEYISSNREVTITCRTHGDFKQRPNSHLSGRGCSRCSNNYKNSTTDFIRKSNLIHGDKYDYSLVDYKGAFVYTTITCSKHGDFKQRPNNHLNGHGCPSCSIEIISDKNSINLIDFINKSIRIHGDKYDYSLVKYKNMRTYIDIICDKHGVFNQTPSNHIYGKSGCPKCGSENIKNSKVKNKEELVNSSIVVHGDKYDYSLVEYIGTESKVDIVCKKHGIFKQKIYKHIQGQGCPICKESKLEKEVRNFLIKNNIEFIREFGVGNQRLDFYLPKQKIAIECQGEQHFKPVDFGNKGYEFSYNKFLKDVSNDNRKYDKCKELGIDIIYYCDEIHCDNNNGYIGYLYCDISKINKKIKTNE